jgi:hypothetical protein
MAGARALSVLAGTAAPASSPSIVSPGGELRAVQADTLQAAFARPEQTIEYHFMLDLPLVPEDSLARQFAVRIAAPLRGVADVGPLGEGEACAYVDSRQRVLSRNNLIVRVRDRRVTVMARASATDRLLGLPACSARKYELDDFGVAEYSISSDLKFRHQDDVHPFAGDAARVWEWIARDCPELWERIRPVVADAGACEIRGIAHTYTADVTLRHADAARAQEASLTVWYFPPTGRALVELSFTGLVRDREALERMHRYLRAMLVAKSLLRADQASKTQQYFDAYSRSGSATPR